MGDRTNEIVRLKGQLHHAPASSRGGPVKLTGNRSVTSAHLRGLAKDLESVMADWDDRLMPQAMLITTDYREVIAKSNRMTALFRTHVPLSELVKGARFAKAADGKLLHHVITYLLPTEAVRKAACDLERAARLIDALYAGTFRSRDFERLPSTDAFREFGFSQSHFMRLLKDAHYVGGFRIDAAESDIRGDALVSLYRIGSRNDLLRVMGKIGLRIAPRRFLNDDTLLLREEEYQTLRERAGWLVAMEVSDMMEFNPDEPVFAQAASPIEALPKPTDEPVIGVFDTRFDIRAYFAEWVEYRDLLPKESTPVPADFKHGTAVSSIIVNGPVMNPELDDGCGFFRVRHFAVAQRSGMSTFELLRMIRETVRTNPDIKIWNVSLGSRSETGTDFISPEAAELDRIQREFDVLFVIAGTNLPFKPSGTDLSDYRIGAPADSLLSLVVNACGRTGEPAPYSRRGPALDFFQKPDLCARGGTDRDPLTGCTHCGAESVLGTSYAAPWVARKAAYLMCRLRMSRTEAKALLIDAALGWEERKGLSPWLGYGVLPLHVGDVVRSPKNEIRFIISGVVGDYETYTYDLPIPQTSEGLFDYDVRATLCCFPETRRDQGVDYTLTELDFKFGRVKMEEGKPVIRSIDSNRQGDDVSLRLPESTVRQEFRKLDNVKVLRSTYRKSIKPMTASGVWGWKVCAKERLPMKYCRGMPFSTVVTLRSREGANRLSAFVKACQVRGWLVNRIEVEALQEVFIRAEEELTLE